MSKNTNIGLSKIPKFGSRIPHPASIRTAISTTTTTTQVHHHHPVAPSVAPITKQHLGRAVRVGDKEGLLRYLGAVRFSRGTWCGIELCRSIGKNDGSVNGVRYFQCAAGRGLMAPLSKVELLVANSSSSNSNNVGSRESLNDDVSGPYSMLFINPDARANEPYELNDSSDQNTTITLAADNKAICSNTTYTNENIIEQRIDLNTGAVNVNKQNTDTFNRDSSNETFNRTATHSESSKSSNIPLNVDSLPPLLLEKFSTPQRSDFNEPLFKNLRISSIGCLDNTSNQGDDSKRDSLECEESLGILTPGQIDENTNQFYCLFDESVFAAATAPSEMPGPSETKSNHILSETFTNHLQNNKIDDSKPTTLNLPQQLLSSSNDQTKDELQHSPNNHSTTDYSIGIINEQMLSNVTLITDITMNLDLPLDSIDNSKMFSMARLEQTPSPEELPLDPTPIIIEMDPKIETSKSKTTNTTNATTTNNCFITSITSITSLDTGYQGDGEMSRPASRGADNSPLTRRPLQRPQTHRRQDPMTDSDFYTESDADNLEETHLRGDRKAQVIDGTLYGVDPQAAADIYVNNRENMDSSGIFTDLETNNSSRNDDIGNLQLPDPSPSDTSTKTISENSQSNLQDVLLVKNNAKKDVDKQQHIVVVNKENPKKRNAPSPGVSSPLNFSSPRHGVKENTNNNTGGSSAKKYKMPRRDVPSKLKAMLEPRNVQVNEKKLIINKPAGKWDAVMNKISKNDQNKTNLKDVKSKVFNDMNINVGHAQIRQIDNGRKIINQNSVANQKVQNNKLITKRQTPTRLATGTLTNNSKTTPLKRPRSAQSHTSAEKRRVRNRLNSASTSKINGTVESSIHSSLSDLSAATLPPNNKTIGSAKKQRGGDVQLQVTQVLTANKLSPRIQQQQQNAIENKKNATLHTSPSKTRRNLFTPKAEKQVPSSKECGRGGTVKGGRISPTVRPTTQHQQNQQQHQTQQQTKVAAAIVKKSPTPHQARLVEGLAVLVQHLIFNVGAFQVPSLRKKVEKYRLEAEEIRLKYQHLEESLINEKIHYQQLVDEERVRYQKDIEQRRHEVEKLTRQYAELEECLLQERENSRQNLCKQHEEQLTTLKNECIKLQRTHEESLEILREENEAIREQIDEKRLELEKADHESRKIKEDYENKVKVLEDNNQKLKHQIANLQNQYEEKIAKLLEESKRLREENDRLLGYGDNNGIGLQEVQSLRAVLELKQTEVTELRIALGKATQKAEILEGAEERARVLNARCEDLQLQLERKSEYEKSLLNENQKLQESFKEETNQNRRLSRYNEELRWKLEQNKEVVAKVFEQAEDCSFNRSIYSSSFNERHHLTASNLERNLSFRERTYSNRSSMCINEDQLLLRSGGRKSKNNFEFESTTTEDPSSSSSPPTSPKVKGVVEKSDSVSYVLDLDESPEIVASRILRRSFRNTTPPKNTPTKSPSNKKARIRVVLNQSASSSDIISPTINETERSHSANSKCAAECDNDIDEDDDYDDESFSWSNLTTPSKYHRNNSQDNKTMKFNDHHLDLNDEEEDNEVVEDIPLPALPSELNRRSDVQALPTPKHLAGDAAMVSESNSEDDESTSSSQL